MLLIAGDGSRVRFNRISGSGSYMSGVFEANDSPGFFFKAQMQHTTTPTPTMEVKTRSGEIFRFRTGAYQGYLRKKVDRFGNSTKISRSGSQIQRDESKRTLLGLYLYRFSLDRNKRFTGRSVLYTHTVDGLTKVTYPDNTTEEYTYNAGGMSTVKDRRGNIMVTNEYDANQRVIKQTLADGAIYQFAYTLDGNGNVTRTDVTRPRGLVRRIDFDAKGYITQETHAFGTPLAQTWTYSRQAGTNFLTSETVHSTAAPTTPTTPRSIS